MPGAARLAGQAVAAAAERAPELRGVLGGGTAASYLPDAGALAAAGLAPGAGSGSEAGFLPPGSRCVLLQALRPLPADGPMERLGETHAEGLGSRLPDALHPGGDGALPGGAAAASADGVSTEGALDPTPWQGGLLVLAADRPRALSVRERLWAATVAAKLAALELSTGS